MITPKTKNIMRLIDAINENIEQIKMIENTLDSPGVIWIGEKNNQFLTTDADIRNAIENLIEKKKKRIKVLEKALDEL